MSVERYLTLPEYLKLTKYGRTTVFDWMRRGKLRQGVHFIRRGRTLRFVWPEPLTPEPPVARVKVPVPAKPARARFNTRWGE